MELLTLVIVVVGIALFVLFLKSVHHKTEFSHHAVVKIYVDDQILEIEPDKILVGGSMNVSHYPGHFEEIVEVLNRFTDHEDVYADNEVYSAVNKLLKHPDVQKFVRADQFAVTYETKTSIEHGYGGCYFQTKENIAMVHAIGDPKAILMACSQVHDKDGILRVSQKWEKQNYTVNAIATADVNGGQKNVLAYDIKEKMIFLGLIATKKQ